MNMKTPKLSLLIMAGSGLISLPAFAQNSLTVPVEVLRVGNPDLAPESRGNVTLYRIHPQYTLRSVQGSARTELALGAMVERSSDTSLSADRNLPSLRFLWENSTPLSVFGLRAAVEESSTRETDFEDFGRVSIDSKARTGTLGGTWTQNLSQDTSLETAVSHSRVSYDTPQFVDYSESLGSVTYQSRMSPNSRYSVMGSLSQLDPSGSLPNGTRLELGGGYEIELREGTLLNVKFGAVRTSAEVRKTDPVGGMRLAYTGERASYSVAWAREVSSGGTQGGYTKSDSFDALVTYPFTVNTSASLGVSRVKSLEIGRETGTTAYLRMRSELSQFWTLTVGVEQRRASSDRSPTGRGNSVAVGLTYSHPDF